MRSFRTAGETRSGSRYDSQGNFIRLICGAKSYHPRKNLYTEIIVNHFSVLNSPGCDDPPIFATPRRLLSCVLQVEKPSDRHRFYEFGEMNDVNHSKRSRPINDLEFRVQGKRICTIIDIKKSSGTRLLYRNKGRDEDPTEIDLWEDE